MEQEARAGSAAPSFFAGCDVTLHRFFDWDANLIRTYLFGWDSVSGCCNFFDGCCVIPRRLFEWVVASRCVTFFWRVAVSGGDIFLGGVRHDLHHLFGELRGYAASSFWGNCSVMQHHSSLCVVAFRWGSLLDECGVMPRHLFLAGCGAVRRHRG